MLTLLEVIERGTHYLEKHGVPEARLNMQLLAAHHLGMNRIQLYLNFDRPLTDDELAPLRANLKKRSQRIPLQHLLGNVEFLGRSFKSDARALIPRPETEELVALLLHQNLPAPTRILDMGTGSGIIGITLALSRQPSPTEVVLADTSPDALALAKENAQTLAASVTLLHTDLFDKIDDRFDLIVANLPYVPEIDRAHMEPELTHDPAAALFSGPTGLDHLRRFIAELPPHLNDNALVALEIGHDQATEVAHLLQSAGLRDIFVHQDLTGIPRFPFARK